MKRLSLIFLATILATVASFAVLYFISPEEERGNTLSTQGIRLVGSAIVYSNTSGEQAPAKIRIGDLLIGSGEQVFKVIELRKAQSGDIYVVVSSKFIRDFKTFRQFQSEPYAGHKTYELKAFAFNKMIIQEQEIAKFYKEYAKELETTPTQAQIEAAQPTTTLPPKRQEPSTVAQPTRAAPEEVATIAPERKDTAPRGWERAAVNESQAFSTAEVSPDDLTQEEREMLSQIEEQAP